MVEHFAKNLETTFFVLADPSWARAKAEGQRLEAVPDGQIKSPFREPRDPCEQLGSRLGQSDKAKAGEDWISFEGSAAGRAVQLHGTPEPRLIC